MSTKQIAEALRDRLANVAEKGRVLGQALIVRADLAAARRRLRAGYTELGEAAYTRLQDGGLEGDAAMNALVDRIDGFKAEVRLREAELKQIMRAGFRSNGESGGQAAERVSASKADDVP